MDIEEPILRHVDKTHPLYPLNTFSRDFAMKLGKEIIYLLATRSSPRLEGEDWEEIFARCVGAKWTPSNVGLDDVTLGQMSWGAKTVKNKTPFDVKTIRLISGRNSPAYSFHIENVKETPNNELGSRILSIWNARVKEVRAKFPILRTVVLIKSDDLSRVSVFETDTKFYQPEYFYWQWNERDNLEGYERATDVHRFTWQPHGSQFTIVEGVPPVRLKLKIKIVPKVSHKTVLDGIKFDESWIQIIP